MLITFASQRHEPIKIKSKFCTPASNLQLKNQPACDQINFGQKNNSYEFALKKISGLPCAYCGKIMHTNQEQKLFGVEIAELTGKKLRDKLAFLRASPEVPFEQNIANLLTEKSKELSGENIQELLIDMFPDAEKKLIQHQTKILNQLPEIMNKLTGATKEKAFGKLDEMNSILNKKNSDLLFKKKAILDSFKIIQEAETNPDNKSHLKKAFQVLVTLPRAKDDTNAFIVKYSRRSPRETGEVLIDPFTSSAEHLIPDSKGGSSKPFNLLCIHKHCNENRNVQEIPDLIKNNSTIILHIKNHLKIVTKKIKQYEVFGFSRYPTQIAKTLKTLSNGEININTKNYHPPSPKLEKIQAALVKKGNS